MVVNGKVKALNFAKAENLLAARARGGALTSQFLEGQRGKREHKQQGKQEMSRGKIVGEAKERRTSNL